MSEIDESIKKSVISVLRHKILIYVTGIFFDCSILCYYVESKYTLELQAFCSF